MPFSSDEFMSANESMEDADGHNLLASALEATGEGPSAQKPSQSKKLKRKRKRRRVDEEDDVEEAEGAEDVNVKKSSPSPESDVKKKVTRRLGRGRPLTLEQLQKYRHFLRGLAKVRSGSEVRAIFEKLKNQDFNMVCNCMHEFLQDQRGYFSDEQRERAKKLISPFAKKLKRVTNLKLPIATRRRVLGQKQKGGSSTVSDIIGSLLPMAVEALIAL